MSQCAGTLIKFAAAFDADGLGGGDLNMVDMVAIPQRLEQAIGETQHHDVLHGLLAKKMVDPINLMLLQRLQDFGVECFGGREIVAKGFFYDDAAPGSVL